MIDAILALAVSLSTPYIPKEKQRLITEDVIHVVSVSEPLFQDTDSKVAREKTAKLLLVWAWLESAWNARAVGDGGQSIGVLQITRQWLGSSTVAEVLADRRLGLRIGLGIMRQARDKCGSVKSGLGMYASGKCGHALPIAAHRCKLAGLTSECR